MDPTSETGTNAPAAETFARLFEAVHEGVYIGVIDPAENATLFANPFLRLMFGYAADAPPIDDLAYNEDEQASRIAADLEAVFDVPVQVSAVLGRSKMDVGELLKLGPGTVLELDRRVGEAIDIYVNNRLVARGEVVLVEDKLGVTMTEIIKAERS